MQDKTEFLYYCQFSGHWQCLHSSINEQDKYIQFFADTVKKYGKGDTILFFTEKRNIIWYDNFIYYNNEIGTYYIDWKKYNIDLTVCARQDKFLETSVYAPLSRNRSLYTYTTLHSSVWFNINIDFTPHRARKKICQSVDVDRMLLHLDRRFVMLGERLD